MIKQELLNKELEFYKRKGCELEPVKFNKNHFYNLFKKYKYWGMTENSYCCYGEAQCCWQELYEDGNCNYTFDTIKRTILESIKYAKRLIRNTKQGNRFYMYKDKERCYIYIYLRDTEAQLDLAIWFDNGEE